MSRRRDVSRQWVINTEAFERCETGTQGHVMKLDNSVAVRCVCGHDIARKRCVRCNHSEIDWQQSQLSHRTRHPTVEAEKVGITTITEDKS